MNILPKVLEPVFTDELFTHSPDAGHPTCLCSRCGAHIKLNEAVIRVFATAGFGITRSPLQGEYRFCEACTTGTKYFYCEPEGETGFRCSKQCEDCKNRENDPF